MINPKFGYTLLRDRRVPVRSKLLALGIGAVVIAGVEVLQLPLETLAAALMPLVGAAGDVAFNGAETVIGPVLVACLVLPCLTPAAVVERIRAESAAP